MPRKGRDDNPWIHQEIGYYYKTLLRECGKMDDRKTEIDALRGAIRQYALYIKKIHAIDIATQVKKKLEKKE
jgi:hypothetical protein